MPDFRKKTPTRTCNKSYASYRSFKKYLVADFSNRCGYCDGSDTWYGGYKSFHIDHFAPKDQFPILENDYSNLIYSCPSCNNAKSNKWPSNNAAQNIVGNKGFLNPVSHDFNLDFERDNEGRIIGKTAIANDMILNLNLQLDRHSVIWMLTKLEELIHEFKEKILSNAFAQQIKSDVETIHYNLLKIYFEYHLKLKSLNV